ncbi:MAG: protein translocase subunit SecD [Alphaproteobacteria bacterium]|nr:protein translocase subunit SecD [Alphaproteobacteria bacterium]
MLQFSPIRTAIIALAALLGIVFVAPNLVPSSVLSSWPGMLPKQQIVLGLDLQGGSHLLLQVDRESIVSERIKELRRDIRSTLANEKGIGNLISTEGDTLIVELVDPVRAAEAVEAIKTLDAYSGAVFSTVSELSVEGQEDGRIKVGLTESGLEQRMTALVAQSIEVIRKRIDELGTTEPTIQRQGNDRVLVQVPGFEDSARLKDIISRTARLTFHLVYTGLTATQAEAQGLPAGTYVVANSDGAGSELLYEDVSLGGESLVDAQAGYDQRTSRPVVTFKFDTRGAIVFSEITSANVGKRFAIVLDNQVITAPVIQTAITGGSGQIYGNFTVESANDLAVLLRAGALPATLDIIEERSVGPSLGADSVQAGVVAGLIGAVAVMVFMVLAYGLFGVFAVLSLILNITLLLGILSALGATLTLPGIAGIVLTVGMAVDANVLIYERIREEQRAGRTPVQAIEAGFQRAIGTIMDANLTTLIAAVILFFLGSGPVQGFAVTLAIGILTTLFTAYLVTLFIVGRWFSWRRPKTLHMQIFRFVPDGTQVPFMSWRKIALAGSTLAMVASVVAFFTLGLNLGIDFKGGSSIEIQAVSGEADIGDIRSRLGGLNLGDVQVQGFGTPEDVLIRLETQPGGDTAQQDAVEAVTNALDPAVYEVRRTESVGPTVSGELAVGGAVSVLIALVAILIYIWFRFEWQFALGAVVATTHDVILTIGFYSLLGIEFNLSSIAAVLTIVGYSLNDTVVVYDRVREFMRKFRKLALLQLLDDSINSTLGRTTLTAFTTILALLALVFFGGEVIRGFTLSMTWGIVVGTYSSIFIASPVLLLLGLKNRAPVEKEKTVEKRADGASV